MTLVIREGFEEKKYKKFCCKKMSDTAINLLTMKHNLRILK